MAKKQRIQDSPKKKFSDALSRFARSPWFSLFILAAVGFLSYSNSFKCSFHLDDEGSIIFNPTIRQLTDLKAMFLNTPTRLLTYLSFALNYHFGGLDVTGYHMVNLAIHISASFALWLLAKQIFRTPVMRDQPVARAAAFIALAVALIFVSHPLQTQAVTYIVQRAASLASFFYALSLYFYGAGRLEQLQQRRRSRIVLFYGLSALAGLLALCSKEISLSLPFAMLVYDFFFFRVSGKINWKFTLAVLVFFVVFPLILLTQNLFSLTDIPPVAAWKYLLTQPRVIVTYMRLLVFPVDQNLDYDFLLSKSLFEFATAGSILVLLALAVLAYKLYGRHRVLSFGLVWFILTLLPESSVIPLPDVIFEHRAYLPLFGFALFLVTLLFNVVGRRNLGAFLLIILGCTTVLAWMTHERNNVWKNEITLWSDVIQKSPLKPRAYNNRGRALGDLGRLQEALADFDRALFLDPTYPDPYNNRANIYVQEGMSDAAIADCNKALEHESHLYYQRSRIYFNRGTAYIQKGKLDSAIADLTTALHYDPTHESSHFNRAIAYSRQNEFEKAIEDYNAVIAGNPQHAKAFNNRGVLFKSLGRLNEALSDFNESIRIQPDNAQAHLNRGMVWSLKGDLPQAEADLSIGLKSSPNSVEGLRERGAVYARKGEYDKALLDFDRALTLDPTNASLREDRKRAFQESLQRQSIKGPTTQK